MGVGCVFATPHHQKLQNVVLLTLPIELPDGAGDKGDVRDVCHVACLEMGIMPMGKGNIFAFMQFI